MRVKTDLSRGEFEELVRPKLKMFLSVDVVGSTEYKQQARSGTTQDWLNFFLSFFAEFPTLVLAALSDHEPEGSSLEVRLWKSLGDELIFTAEIKRREQVSHLLAAFRDALQNAMELWKKRSEQHGLLLKGAAWLAGFPVGNAEIPLESANPRLVDGSDYIGPQVDTGFRIKEHASPRQLALSADLAYLLVSAGSGPLRLFYEGDTSLKGVMRGKPYPVIWLDCSSADPGSGPGSEQIPVALHELQDTLLGRKCADPGILQRYLRLWFEERRGVLPVPFIYLDPFEGFQPPARYEENRARVERELQDHFLQQQGGDAPASEEEAGGGVPDRLSSFLGH